MAYLLEAREDELERNNRYHEEVMQVSENLLSGDYSPWSVDNFREAIGELPELAIQHMCDGFANGGIAYSDPVIRVSIENYWARMANFKAVQIVDERERERRQLKAGL